MRKSVLFVATASLLGLSACASGGGLFSRGAPDEFQVSRQAPLVVPPDFSLVPPQPGAPRPTADSASEQTLQALFGGPAQRSAAESAAVRQAGGARAESGIRSEAGDPTTNTVDKGTVVRDIISAPQGAGQNATADTPQ